MARNELAANLRAKLGVRDWTRTCGRDHPNRARFKDHLNEAHREELKIPTSEIYDIATAKGFSICVKCGKALKATAAGGTHSHKCKVADEGQAALMTPKPNALPVEMTPKMKRSLLALHASPGRSQNDRKRSRVLSKNYGAPGMPLDGISTRSGRKVTAKFKSKHRQVSDSGRFYRR